MIQFIDFMPENINAPRNIHDIHFVLVDFFRKLPNKWFIAGTNIEKCLVVPFSHHFWIRNNAPEI
ncbi:hypothetical protein SDC9_145765 [bioreactor metagenome]|uniref:Uncharacterized protein n=1 Tax=bioreactor metagenome TaxID=1076179 RepID=A0A645E9H7_9ZZZZ